MMNYTTALITVMVISIPFFVIFLMLAVAENGDAIKRSLYIMGGSFSLAAFIYALVMYLHN